MRYTIDEGIGSIRSFVPSEMTTENDSEIMKFSKEGKLLKSVESECASDVKLLCLTSKPDYAWAYCLNKVILMGMTYQYLLAYISTLGGAYHLCDQPVVAMKLANMMCFLGSLVGNDALIVKANIYRAVNFSDMGHTQVALLTVKRCKRISNRRNWSSLIGFCDAVEHYIKSTRNPDKTITEK